MNTLSKAFKLCMVMTLFVGVVSAYAAGNGPEKHPGSASMAEVSYIGSQEGEPLFHVSYNNSTGARFSIRVLDGEGHQLYQRIFTDKKFDKKFKITNTDTPGKMVFIVRSFGDNSVQSFQVDSDTRMVEDVEVKEVK